MGAGFATIGYSVENGKDEELSTGKFVAGWLANAGIGFATGAVTAFVGGPIGQLAARFGTFGKYAATIALRAIVGSAMTVADQAVFNAVQRNIIGQDDVNISDGLGLAAIAGGVLGGLGGAWETRVTKFERPAYKFGVTGKRIWLGVVESEADGQLRKYPLKEAIGGYLFSEQRFYDHLADSRKYLTSVGDIANLVLALHVPSFPYTGLEQRKGA